MTKLHLGCGEVYLEGYVNIDFPPSEHTVQRRSRVDQYADITELVYQPGSIDEIRLHHVFEHFPRSVALRLLIDWYLWLRVGGKLLIETPDFERSAAAIRSFEAIEPANMLRLRHIFGSQEAGWAVHQDGWYAGKFRYFLERLGYGKLAFVTSEWKATHNLTVSAEKVEPVRERHELQAAAEQILRLSLVDESESERRLLAVWMREIDRAGRSGKPAD